MFLCAAPIIRVSADRTDLAGHVPHVIILRVAVDLEAATAHLLTIHLNDVVIDASKRVSRTVARFTTVHLSTTAL